MREPDERKPRNKGNGPYDFHIRFVREVYGMNFSLAWENHFFEKFDGLNGIKGQQLACDYANKQMGVIPPVGDEKDYI